MRLLDYLEAIKTTNEMMLPLFLIYILALASLLITQFKQPILKLLFSIMQFASQVISLLLIFIPLLLGTLCSFIINLFTSFSSDKERQDTNESCVSTIPYQCTGNCRKCTFKGCPEKPNRNPK